MEAEEDLEKQRLFYDTVRETIISLLVFLGLYLLSYLVVARFQRHISREDCYTGEEDKLVYRITTWLCSFALSVSVGSALLLPVSIFSNEILVLYPHSNYVQWLNTSLIRGLWNMVFFGCNISLFVFLPFAYFFTESAGLSGSRKGVMSRVYETLLVLLLLAVLVCGLSWLLTLLLDHDTSWDPWFLYLPLLYSVMSLLGVVVMGICTPLGVSHLFTVLGALITSPKPTTNVEEELEEMRLEEMALQRRVKLMGGGKWGRGWERRTENFGASAAQKSRTRAAPPFLSLGAPCSLPSLLPGSAGCHHTGSAAGRYQLHTAAPLSRQLPHGRSGGGGVSAGQCKHLSSRTGRISSGDSGHHVRPVCQCSGHVLHPSPPSPPPLLTQHTPHTSHRKLPRATGAQLSSPSHLQDSRYHSVQPAGVVQFLPLVLQCLGCPLLQLSLSLADRVHHFSPSQQSRAPRSLETVGQLVAMETEKQPTQKITHENYSPGLAR